MDATDAKQRSGVVPMTARRRDVFAGLIGIAAAIATLAAAGVVALLLGLASPLFSVGALVIDLAPPGVKEFAIALFGTGDKAFLIVVLAVVVLVAAIASGILQSRRPPLGVILLLVVALVALVAALTRANASVLNGAPTVVGAIVGTLVLRGLTASLERWRNASTQRTQRSGSSGLVERRSFLQYLAVGSVVGILVGVGAQTLAGVTGAASTVLNKIRLPVAATPAPPIPTGAELHVPGLTPYITPNTSFYRIDTALVVPSVDPKEWKLTISGMVEKKVVISFAELLAKPLEEHPITLTCVSQEVGGNLIGNAVWLGYPIRNLLAEAQPTPGADMVLSTSVDGFTAGTPLSVLQDPGTAAMLAVGMNGEQLPPEHGFPVRMVVPGLYGYVSATKWVVDLKVTTFARDQAYWTPRGYSAKGPIKLSSRIDTPKDGRRLTAGTVAIAGVAWDQHVGIAGVQVQIDDEPWADATLARVASVDTWLQWMYHWPATKGNHQVAVRAINVKGEVQTSALASPVPNGGTGLHTIAVGVG
ncbi:MAG TPA: molybdopterin-dependent oxidoreductase [Galbitalea sp.]|nr:molybdopterin-dependent oxidoreductase [Galbitalea sp.]